MRAWFNLPNNQMNNAFKKEKGFTLLEMLISIMIITIAVLPIYQAVFKYTRTTQFERESFVASYLCQEGIEFIKNIRDTNWIQGVAWDTGLSMCLGSGCEGGPYGLRAWTGNKLVIDEATTASGFYRQIDAPLSGDIVTSFTRKIQITQPTADEIDITVTVYWGNNTMVVKENIFNWR
jgi:prepilin-type N-terminal cleavage/methylation domain-containing protein